MSLKFKKGDTVKVLTGKDRGKTGKVLEVLTASQAVIVEGANLVTMHRKPRKMREKGQKVLKPSPLRSSNLMLVCSNCGKPTRVSYKINEQGHKNRVCKHCQKFI